MAIIKYMFADGHIEEIEVSEKLKESYDLLENRERNNNRRETRRHQSWDKLQEFNDFLIKPDTLDIIEKIYIKQLLEIINTVLTDKQKTIFDLHYYYGYTKTEIADKLKIRESAVRKQIKYIENKIKIFFN